MTLQALVSGLISEFILKQVNAWERSHERAAILRALKQRSRWRKCDAQRLLRMALPPVAQRRVVDLKASKKLGRGVVDEPKDLATVILNDVITLKQLFDSKTPPHVRRALYKKTRWFPEFVEQAYRGELEIAKSANRRTVNPRLRPHEIADVKLLMLRGFLRPAFENCATRFEGEGMANRLPGQRMRRNSNTIWKMESLNGC